MATPCHMPIKECKVSKVTPRLIMLYEELPNSHLTDGWQPAGRSFKDNNLIMNELLAAK
jgi:hypothetical protein